MTKNKKIDESLNDAQMMQLAAKVSLASRDIARPNPWVGAVILSVDGTLATGATRSPGSNHAEIEALSKVGDKARGATMWVTLEPCSHHGKTPPCTNAIIDAGVSRVIVGSIDPDKKVNGRGIENLRSAGIEVVTGIETDTVQDLLAPYLISRVLNRPFVLLKMASTLDGYIAAADMSSKWITNEKSRRQVQKLRLQSDVIVVGANTVRYDDPSLRVVEYPLRSPKRVVFGKIPDGARILPAIEFHGEASDFIHNLSLDETLTVMVEGGARVANSFLADNLIDEFHLFIAPKILGGSNGVRLFEGNGASSIAQAIDFDLCTTSQHGGDIELKLRSKRATEILKELKQAAVEP